MTGESVDVEALLWSCPDCGFTFSAEHTDPDGGYSCPACAEHTLLDALAAATARAEAAEAREAALRAGVEAFAEECERMSASHADPKVRVRSGRTADRLRALLATGGAK